MNKWILKSLVVALLCILQTHAFYKQTNVTLDTSDAQTQDIGVVNKQIMQKISLPTSGKKIVEITPVQGTYVNQPIKVLFYAIEFKKAADTTQPLNIQAAAKKLFADSNIKKNAQSLIAIYRQLPGEDQWTSMAEIPTLDTITDLAADDAIKLIINGRAEVIATLPAYQAAVNDRNFNKVGTQQIKIIPQKGAPSIQGSFDAVDNSHNTQVVSEDHSASMESDTDNAKNNVNKSGSSDQTGFVMD